MLRTYQRDAAGRWQLGPVPAYLGAGGLAAPGQKREGDGRTPAGVFGFAYAFGVDPNPGVRLAWRQVDGPQDVWDDDPVSPNYNE